jgi:hypothetical protein
MASSRDMVAEKFLRYLDKDAGAVAGHAVGIDRAPVPQRLQRLDTGFDNLAARFAVDRGDQADATGILAVDIKIRIVFQQCRIPLVPFDEFRSVVHADHSAATAVPAAAID